MLFITPLSLFPCNMLAETAGEHRVASISDKRVDGFRALALLSQIPKKQQKEAGPSGAR